MAVAGLGADAAAGRAADAVGGVGQAHHHGDIILVFIVVLPLYQVEDIARADLVAAAQPMQVCWLMAVTNCGSQGVPPRVRAMLVICVLRLARLS